MHIVPQHLSPLSVPSTMTKCSPKPVLFIMKISSRAVCSCHLKQTNKETKNQQQTNKQKKALNSVELRRKVFRSRRNKLQLAKGTKSQPLTQFQTCAGTISKQIIQPVLEESLAQDLLHIAGTALSRKYFFSKGTPSEFTQNMTMCSTK